MLAKLKRRMEIDSWSEFFKPKDFKMIMKLTIPIFIQVLINVIATLVGSLSINWYKIIYHTETGQEVGAYFYAIAKVILVYNLIAFIPTLVSGGVLIICSNIIGQGKEKELPKVIWTGVYVNLIISTIFFLLMYFLAKILLKAMGAVESKKIFGPGGVILQESELSFATEYLQYMLTWLFFYSIAQVFASALQSIKKNNIAVIGAILGNVFAVVFIYSVLFGAKKDTDTMMISAIDYTLGAIIQLTINLFFCWKYIFRKYPTKFKDCFKLKYGIETIALGTPIALEFGVWTISQFLISSAISRGGLGDEYIGLYRAILILSSFSSAFNTAIGAVTNVLVGVEIGKNNRERAFNLGWQLFMVGIYFSSLSGIILIALTHPFLMLFKIDNKTIVNIGYLIVFLTTLKIVLDTANLTILRALWSANDIWVPIIISIFTMLAVQVSVVFMIVDLGFKKGAGTLSAMACFSVVFLSLIIDPLMRSIIYMNRWNNKTWHKYIKKF
ncbi:MATE family efflux transporter [[Mycoplasma] gypis]|uniref:MATE family efflux transporter n=1 Tax=[Mycoplasma] gypis TaxID=92404 RepID=A0ABZ2RPX2_9BACT|nr:MATE family efflux transporter [[Mycoplasma] gypis]MBN0919597.1 oligosaccharide flippase family protein [[Mycoplasma] gypis]